MKIAIISANLGNFDPEFPYIIQDPPEGASIDVFRFNDSTFPPRTQSMSSRLQARIPKMFGWQMAPGYDYYLWVDASFTISNKDYVRWCIEKIGKKDLLLFLHPDRGTIKEEAEYIEKRIKEENEYLKSRYVNELTKEQLNYIFQDESYIDNTLFATCSFFYRNIPKIIGMLENWWVHTSRFHVIDQLSLPYVIQRHWCTVEKIKDNIYKIPYLTYTRNKKG